MNGSNEIYLTFLAEAIIGAFIPLWLLFHTFELRYDILAIGAGCIVFAMNILTLLWVGMKNDWKISLA